MASQKQLELVYRIAEDALKRQIQRFYSVEEKVWRHAALVGLVLGGFLVGLSEAIEVTKATRGILTCLFAGAYGSTILAALAGLVSFTMAMQYEILGVNPLDRDFADRYLGNAYDYDESLKRITRGTIDTYFQNEKQAFEAKETWAGRGWWCLLAVVIGSGLSVLLYGVLKLT